MRAEDVRFESDENGWEMLVTTEDGFVRRYNIHGIAFDVLKNMNDTIGDWYRRGWCRHERAAGRPRPGAR